MQERRKRDGIEEQCRDVAERVNRQHNESFTRSKETFEEVRVHWRLRWEGDGDGDDDGDENGDDDGLGRFQWDGLGA